MTIVVRSAVTKNVYGRWDSNEWSLSALAKWCYIEGYYIIQFFGDTWEWAL